MLSFKTVIEGVVEQGRRLVLHSTRSRANPVGHKSQGLKLTEAQTEKIIGRSQPKGVISGRQQQVLESHGSSSNSLVPARGGIVNILRPVTARLVQGLVRKVSSPFWTEARRRSAKRLFGETAPYFALVGVTLVSGPERGLLTAQDELEAVCGDIREAISRAGWIHNPDFWKSGKSTSESANDDRINKGFSLSDFVLGPSINKGCNAVVYSAKWNEVSFEEDSSDDREITPTVGLKTLKETPKLVESLESLLANENFLNLERLHSERKSVAVCETESINCGEDTEGDVIECSVKEYDDEALSLTDVSSSTEEEGAVAAASEEILNLSNCYSLTSINDTFNSSRSSLVSILRPQTSVSLSGDLNLLLSNGHFEPRSGGGALKRKKVKFKDDSESEMESRTRKQLVTEAEAPCSRESTTINDYPLAMKMMFNYEAESNAPAILTAMYKEMIPARSIQLDEVSDLWKRRLLNSTTCLPPHPNIVDMPCVFVDRIPHMPDGLSLYPDALPKRINPSGFGRNMSLFCVMKRYDCTLSEYLNEREISTRVSLLLLTQLLEAIHHINKYGVAHRDLKSDNILICLSEGVDSPRLVLSDFGCCLPDPSLKVSFTSYEADPRVGNVALMAPEVKCATPGMLTWVNYGRSDLWSIGAISYEIFGVENPFSPNVIRGLDNGGGAPKRMKTVLDSATYREHNLPKLPKTVPTEIKSLIHDMLRKNPRQRPSPTVAATVCQLSLWGPRKWLSRHTLGMPSHREVMQWLLCLSTKVLCEAGTTSSNNNTNQAPHPRENYRGEQILSDKAGGQLEYEVVSTFLRRVHYDDIIQAIKWVRAF